MEHLRNLVNYFRNKDIQVPKASEEVYKHIEETLLPHLLRVIKKDNTLFSEIELFPGMKVPWEGSDEEWKLLHMALLFSVLHSGDIKEKMGRIMGAVKGVIPSGTGNLDEINKILEDEDTQSSLSEILELLMNTRLASIVGDLVQSMNFEGLDLNFENPEDIINMLRNPQESPALSELMDRAKMLLEDRVQTGKINPDELRREIEMLRAKFQSSFGKYLNEAIVGEGNTSGNTSAQILSSHPDARRARMLARLQKKQKEKGRK